MRRHHHRLILGLLLIATGPLVPVLPAQLPGARKAAATPPPAESLPTRATVEARIALATAEVANRGATPDGITPQEVEERDGAIQDVLRVGRRTIEELERRKGLESDRDIAIAAAAAWQGFDRKPPHPVLLVDWYREARATAKLALETQRAAERMFGNQLDTLRTALQSASQRVRAEQDRAGGASSPQEAARQRWRLEAAQWRERAAATQMELGEVALANSRTRAARFASEFDLVDRQCDALRGPTSFTKEDLARVLGGITIERARLQDDLVRAGANVTATTAAVTDAERLVASAEAAGDPVRTTAARAVLARAKARADTADLRVESLRAQQDIFDAEERTWQQRFEFHQRGETAAEARKTREDLARAAAQLTQWQGYLRGKTDANATLIAGSTEDAADPAGAGLAKEGAVREGYYRGTDLSLRRLERLVERWREEVEERIGSATIGERAVGAADTSKAWLQQVWDFELFTASDEVQVDGRTVSIERGVTVRKVVFAAFVLWLGYFLAARVGRLVERVARRKAGTAAGVAAALRRWVVVLGVVVAVFVAFLIAKIPLTVFAFLGGALAIGVGFGTQTLMSNFISGLILLFERPIRVGDIVKIDTEVGTVVEVGLRASTLRRPDGAELVIPNRDFLEKMVANSTLSDRRLRFAISIGVDYGSPTRRVRELLVEAAQAHGEVLKQPEPAVYFEDFGADSLQFTLYYWVDLARSPDPRVVASDLRFMIDRDLQDAGIGISFPQREVHLRTDTPLEVRIRPGDTTG